MNQYLLILVVGLLLGVLGYVLALRERQRREALRDVALRLGLRFDARKDRSIHWVFQHSLFRKGRSREASNNMTGALQLDGYSIEVRMGDYQYVTGSGKSRRTHRHSFACFLLPFAGTPDLLIRKERFGDKLLGGLGFDDIDFESEEFSRRFWVKSGDKRFAYDVVHPRMMGFLLEEPTPQIEIVRDVCLIQEGRGRWDPETFEGAVGWFEAFLSRWPEHLTDQLHPRQGKSP
jgi:hypothetical protein